MFDSSYPCSCLCISKDVNQKSPLIRTFKYYFDTDNKQRYIINVEEYPDNIFILKFHHRSYKNHKLKYNILTNTGNFSKIVKTNIDILIKFNKDFPESHFGFIGARTYCNTKKEYIEDEQDVTKRFKLYKYAVENLIDPDVFEHHIDKTNNTYLLINTKIGNTDKIKDIASQLFEECMN